jgi:transcriptional regulator with XRE-family HTH domain
MKISLLIGDNIRGFREKRGWSQARLGAEAGTSGNYIGEIERSETRLTVEKLSDIAKALKINPIVFYIDGAYRKSPDEIRKALTP